MLTQGFQKFYESITEAPETIFQKNMEDLDKFTPPFAKYTPIYLHTPQFAKYTPVFVFLTGFLPKHLKTSMIM